MKIEIVTKEYADKLGQTKMFGVISEGCTGVWGDGDTLDAAIADAEANQLEYAGAVDMSICWAMHAV